MRGGWRAKSGPAGTQLIPPPTSVPIPLITIAVDPAGLSRTSCRSVLLIGWISTMALKQAKRCIDRMRQARTARIPGPDIRKTMSRAPMVSSSTVGFAPAQVAKRVRTRPVRSLSGAGSGPRVSTDRIVPLPPKGA
ncbi:hypothetical protein ACFCZY_06790 [Streptomyces sp. NPDC056237]|uniref:hypothetical protein n=1 Tax=Streptomyces sp. NPDC056237 TaxID=3345758 RepID=UPI0035DBEC48